MGNIRTLKLNLLADVDNFVKGLDGAQGKFKNFGDKMDGYAIKAGIAFAAVTAGAKSAIDAASDLNESVSKAGVVFGDSTKDILKFGDTAARTVGLSKKEALEAASDFAIFGKAAGLTGKDLTGFSTDLLTLSADLASFNNASIDETINAIGAGLRGESEPLRRFGVLLSADAVNAEALKMGLAATSKELTDQDKVLARQSLILEQTSIQQGDFARTADGAANKQRILAAEIETAKTRIGEGLLPVYQQLLNLIAPVITKISENASIFSTLAIAIGVVSAGIIGLNFAVKTINGTFEAFNNIMKLATGAQALFNTVMSLNPIGLTIIAVGLLGVAFKVAYDKIEPFRDLIDGIWEKLKKLIDGVKNSPIGQAIGDLFSKVTGSRAAGGSVSAGKAYRVGEFGSELFVPNSSGRIVPNNGSNGNVTINLNGIVDAESARRSIERLLQDSGRRTSAVNLVGSAL